MKFFIENPKKVSSAAEARKDKLIEYLCEAGVYKFFEDVIEFLYKETDYFYGPASTRYHGAYPGGGFDHALNVTECLVEITDNLCWPWERTVSPFIIGLFHDATKINAYILKRVQNPETGEVELQYEYNPDRCMRSNINGEDSVLKVMEYFPLTEEEQACIRWHMGAYEGKDSWGGYDAAIRKFPNVLWTHTADMYASKLLEFENEK